MGSVQRLNVPLKLIAGALSSYGSDGTMVFTRGVRQYRLITASKDRSAPVRSICKSCGGANSEHEHFWGVSKSENEVKKLARFHQLLP